MSIICSEPGMATLGLPHMARSAARYNSMVPRVAPRIVQWRNSCAGGFRAMFDFRRSACGSLAIRTELMYTASKMLLFYCSIWASILDEAVSIMYQIRSPYLCRLLVLVKAVSIIYQIWSPYLCKSFYFSRRGVNIYQVRSLHLWGLSQFARNSWTWQVRFYYSF